MAQLKTDKSKPKSKPKSTVNCKNYMDITNVRSTCYYKYIVLYTHCNQQRQS